MTEIKVSDFKKMVPEEWQGFLRKCSSSSYFCSSDYISGFTRVFIIGAYRNSKLVAASMVRLRKMLPGSRLYSGWMDAFIILPEEEPSKNEWKQKIVSELKTFAKEKSLIHLYISHWVRSNDLDLLVRNDFIPEKKWTIYLDLKKNDDQLLKEMDYNHRRAIKKSRQSDLRIENLHGSEACAKIKLFSEIRRETQKRAVKKFRQSSMTLKSEDHLKHILESTYDTAWISFVFVEEKLAAAGLFVGHNNTVIYYLGGSDQSIANKSFASYYLLFENFRYARQKGFEIFDLGGIPVDPIKGDPAYGVYLFKKRFGGTIEQFSGGRLVLRKKLFKILNFLIDQKWLVRLVLRHQKQ
mgnify:CR=1 FL=1